MTKKGILIRYSEIFLKSPPVFRRFENILIRNIKTVLKGKEFELKSERGRIFLYSQDPERLAKKLKYVFGIYSWSPVYILETTSPKEIKKFVSQTFEKQIKKDQTFALRVKVAGKKDYRQQQLAEIVGEGIERKVDLTSPDKEIFIEVREDKTYVFDKVVRGLGGMPVGTSGKVLSLISGGIDSPVASWLMMKRGCLVDYLHFFSFPLVSKKSYFKTKTLVRVLNKYQGRSKIYFVPFAPIQTWLKINIPPKYLVIFYRKFMLKIAQEIALKEGARALVTGDSLGQVASQTLENLRVISEGISLPILRPLICFDKEEIVNLAKEIGTYETSIEPQEDCCTLFTPRHPATRAKLGKIKKEEEKIPQEELIEKALKEVKIAVIK